MRHFVLGLATVILVGCGSTESPNAQATPSKAAGSQSTVSTPSAADDITGFGATDAAWSSRHTEDKAFAPGAVYDADPSVYSGARYVAVNHSNGRVLGYTMNFPPSPATAVKAEVLKEFPSDASILWFSVRDTCAQFETKSAKLGAALGAPAIGDPDGMVFVEVYDVHSDGTSTYDANSINQALVMLGNYATSADAPAC
jgi:hypothetical protein